MEENAGPYAVFVTMGFVGVPQPMFTKMKVLVDDTLCETPVTVVRIMRKDIAREKNIKTDDIYYQIYINANAEHPYACSDNAPK